MAADWSRYIDAALRKIEIAEFHREQLRVAIAASEDVGWRPDVPVQASFEGVVLAVIAATDQVAQAANSALQLGAGNDGVNLFDKAVPAIESRVPEFTGWRRSPFGTDLRRLRTRIVHYSYVKSRGDGGGWVVEAAGTNYDGARDLISYASAAVEYARKLGSIAVRLKESLEIASRDPSEPTR